MYALKYATQKLWDPAKHEGGDKFNGWEEFRKVGVWNSDPYPFRKRWGKMKTKTGMFEFYSETLKEALEKHAEKHGVTVDEVMKATNYLARGEMAFIPHYEEPFILGDEKDYPFIHVDHKSRLNREGRSANCPWYYDFKDLDPGDEMWDDVAKINPLDARKLGIKSGDRVRSYPRPQAAWSARPSCGKGCTSRHRGQVLRPRTLGLRPSGVQELRQRTQRG